MSVENTNNRGGYDGTSKIDSESIVQQYRNLRHQQKQFLRKINLTSTLKSQLFDLEDLRNSNKNNYKQKMVVVLDPFRGRLIMGESAWLDLEKQKQAQRIQHEKAMMCKRCQEQQEKEIEKKQQQMILNKQPEQMIITEEKEQNLKKQQDNNFINNLLSNLFKKNKNKNVNNESEENLKNVDKGRKKGMDYQIKEQIGNESPKIKNIQSKIANKKSKIGANEEKKKKQKVQNIKTEGEKGVKTKSRLSSPLSIESKINSETNQNKKTSNIRTESKKKQKGDIKNEIKNKQKKKTIQEQIEQSSQISSIHERDAKYSQNNRSEILSNKLETDILQQILKEKNKKK